MRDFASAVVGGVAGGIVASLTRSALRRWQQRRYERRVAIIALAQMSAEDRAKLLEQFERINALRPKHRRVGERS